jgi:two-component system, OmpR family, phosphate regulon sensor histidine kinase PhoR
MRMPRMFWRMYGGHLAVMLLTALALFSIFSGALVSFHARQVDRALEAHAWIAAERFSGLLGGPGVEAELHRLTERLGPGARLRITLILPDGTVAGDSDRSAEEIANHRDRPELQAAFSGVVGRAVRDSATVRTPMVYVAVPVHREGAVVGAARVSMPLTEMEEVLGAVRRTVILAGLLILLVAAALSWGMTRRMVRPMERIRQGAERFASGDFSGRLPAEGTAEMGALAETMNTMAAQLEDRLRVLAGERNEREAVLSSMTEGVLAVDTDGRVLSLNRAAAHTFQVADPARAAGRPIEEVFRNARLQQFVREVRAGAAPDECEITVPHGGRRVLQARGAPLLGPGGGRIGAVVVFNDVTRLRQLEKLRRDFVANVSHELKTPITSIKGFVETLRDGAMENLAEARRFLDIVARHADRLNAIIDDLLMLSRLEQNETAAIERHPCAAGDLLRTATEVCAPRAAERNIHLKVECSPEVRISVNPPLIEQALINLIGNAIKYSAEGQTVQIRARAEDDGVQLTVADRGIGIEARHHDRLWERFYRVDKGRSRQDGGTGLGLAIVKHIAQVHGGRVSMESEVGRGSTFTIHLPAA